MGGLLSEVGGFRKTEAELRIALVYPNEYTVGMASLGLHTVYNLLNSYEGVSCERFFLGMDRTIETNSPLDRFDVLAFSFQYELDYLTALEILVAAGIEPLRQRRASPILIAGGPCCYNPMPLLEFFDLFAVGDIEPVADDLVLGLIEGKGPEEIASRRGLLSSELKNATIASIAPDLDRVPAPVNQPRPTTPGFSPALGSTFLVEISRGCNVRCRFCMYSHCNAPRRERSLERVQEIVEEGLRVTGLRRVSLVGAVVTEHSEIKEILSYLAELGVSVSLPSIRTEGVDEEFLMLAGRLGIKTLTVAPEGSPRLRSTLKKDLSEDGLRFACEQAPDHGFERLRLYFITGVPGETPADLQYISDLCAELAPLYGPRRVTASVNPLVPKAHTPTEDLPMAQFKVLRDNYKLLRRASSGAVHLRLQSTRESALQAYLALGGARAGKTMWEARGSKGLRTWRKASEIAGDPIGRIFKPGGEKPWEIIRTAFSGPYLERQKRAILQASVRGAGKH